MIEIYEDGRQLAFKHHLIAEIEHYLIFLIRNVNIYPQTWLDIAPSCTMNRRKDILIFRYMVQLAVPALHGRACLQFNTSQQVT